MAGNYQHKDGRGALFPNGRKTADNQPDERGDFMLNGQLYEISAWIKPGRNGSMRSLSIRPKQERQQQPAQQQGQDIDPDSIPF